MEKELREIAADPRFKIHFTLDSATKPNWTGFTGFVTKEMLEKSMPTPSGNDVLVCQCGPPIMNKLVLDLLKQIGHQEKNMTKF